MLNKLTFLLVIAIGLCACDISDNDALPKDSFLKIYDDSNFDASFIPIDIKQTPDQGYIVLSARRIDESNFAGVHLLKVDKDGQFVAQQALDESLIQPVNNLVVLNDRFYFVAMSDISLQANLIAVSTDTLSVTVNPISGLSYPLYLKQEGEELILLSYDNENKNSVLSVISESGTTPKTESFSIGAGDDVEAPIIEHFTRTGRHLPFFVGKVNNLYYFNGFYNYTLSMVFTDLNGSGPDGVVQGQQDNGGLSSAMSIDGGRFALSRFNFGDNYILPFQNIEMLATTSSTDMEGNPFPELVSDAPVVVKSVEINNQEITLYASNTKSKQVVLLAFSQDGELLGSRYIGYSDPYEIAGFTQTTDGGLAITGTVSVAGRFNRIFISKLSKEQLAEII